MAVRYPILDARIRIATELGRVYPPLNWNIIPVEDRTDNIKGKLPFLKGKLGSPDKTNSNMAVEFTEKLGSPISTRQISKYRNGRIPEPVVGTAMPSGSYRSNR